LEGRTLLFALIVLVAREDIFSKRRTTDLKFAINEIDAIEKVLTRHITSKDYVML